MKLKINPKFILTVWQVLKVASFLAGLPLLIYLIRQDRDAMAFGFMGGSFGLPVTIITWALVALVVVQILLAIFMRGKSSLLKGGIAAMVAFMLILAPVIYMEVGIRAEVNSVREAHNDNPHFHLDRFEQLVFSYRPSYNNVNNLNSRFMSTYALAGMNGRNENNGRNTDTTRTTHNTPQNSNFFIADFMFGQENGRMAHVQTSKNGLPADGWVFGFNDARFIFETFFNTTNNWERDNSNPARAFDTIEQAHNAYLQRLRNNPTSAWNVYRATDELYDIVFGDVSRWTVEDTIMIGGFYYRKVDLHAQANGMITAGRLRDIIEDVIALLAVGGGHAGMPGLLNLVSAALSDFAPVIRDLLATNATYEGFLIGLSHVLLNSDFNIGELLNAPHLNFNPPASAVHWVAGTGAGLLHRPAGNQLRPEYWQLMEDFMLQLLDEFLPHQSPVILPIFYFIEDEDIRNYAFARHLATTHGAAVGSVLISFASSNPRVGNINMDSEGSSPMSEWDIMRLFTMRDIWQAEMGNVIAWLAVRENLLIFAGIVPLAVFMAYLFAGLEKKQFNKILEKREDRK